MVIHNQEVDDKFKIRLSNCSTDHTTIPNINYDDNNQIF